VSPEICEAVLIISEEGLNESNWRGQQWCDLIPEDNDPATSSDTFAWDTEKKNT
jgi:hypothetical protein